MTEHLGHNGDNFSTLGEAKAIVRRVQAEAATNPELAEVVELQTALVRYLREELEAGKLQPHEFDRMIGALWGKNILQLREQVSLAVHDALTGLPNRRLFEPQAETLLAADQRQGLPTTVAFLDLDHFKDVNTRFGHGVGDIVLRQTAHYLDSRRRDSDLLARIGGEEFAILFRGITASQAVHSVLPRFMNSMAATIDENLKNQGVHLGRPITMSVGMVDTHVVGYSGLPYLLEASNQAMQQAKDNGRDRAVSVVLDEPPNFFHKRRRTGYDYAIGTFNQLPTRRV